MSDSQSEECESLVQELRNELETKAADYDLLARNLKMRINVAETEAKNLAHEAKTLQKCVKEEKDKMRQLQHRTNLQVEALERHLKEETERHKITQTKYDHLRNKVKKDLETQVKHLQENEGILKDEQTILLSEVEELKVLNEGMNRKMREKDREYVEQVEKETKAAENRVKSRLEKNWLDKLKRTEENASQDVSMKYGSVELIYQQLFTHDKCTKEINS